MEMCPQIAKITSLNSMIVESVLNHLKRLNSEFANYALLEKQALLVELLSYGDSEYFPIGVKDVFT